MGLLLGWKAAAGERGMLRVGREGRAGVSCAAPRRAQSSSSKCESCNCDFLNLFNIGCKAPKSERSPFLEGMKKNAWICCRG